METIDTGVRCRSCHNGTIVAEVNSVPTVSEMDIPIGPGSVNYYRTEVEFYCVECGVAYHHPPGKPDAASEIIDKIRREKEEERDRPLREAREKWQRDLLIGQMLDREIPIPENASREEVLNISEKRELAVLSKGWREMSLEELLKVKERSEAV